MTDFDPSNTTLMGTGAVAHPLSKKSTWLADRSFQLEILRQTALRHLGQFLQLHQREPEPGCSADEASAAYELAREQIRYDLTELSALLREELHRSQRRYGEIALVVLFIPLKLALRKTDRLAAEFWICGYIAWLVCFARVVGGPLVRKKIIRGVNFLKDLVDKNIRLYQQHERVLEGWGWEVLKWI